MDFFGKRQTKTWVLGKMCCFCMFFVEGETEKKRWKGEVWEISWFFACFLGVKCWEKENPWERAKPKNDLFWMFLSEKLCERLS